MRKNSPLIQRKYLYIKLVIDCCVYCQHIMFNMYIYPYRAYEFRFYMKL